MEADLVETETAKQRAIALQRKPRAQRKEAAAVIPSPRHDRRDEPARNAAPAP